jgi:hypothetical protein
MFERIAFYAVVAVIGMGLEAIAPGIGFGFAFAATFARLAF